VHQTVVRRLAQEETSDPLLNPFIEVYPGGAVPGYSIASSNVDSAVPRTHVLPRDVVVSGPGPDIGPPPSRAFLIRRLGVESLPQAEVDRMISLDPLSASPFELNTLWAVCIGHPRRRCWVDGLYNSCF
jgi:hypothetical protein